MIYFLDGLIISHLPFGPTAFFGLSNCVLRHDIDNVAPLSLAYPHLIFHNITTKLGERVSYKQIIMIIFFFFFFFFFYNNNNLIQHYIFIDIQYS